MNISPLSSAKLSLTDARRSSPRQFAQLTAKSSSFTHTVATPYNDERGTLSHLLYQLPPRRIPSPSPYSSILYSVILSVDQQALRLHFTLIFLLLQYPSLLLHEHLPKVEAGCLQRSTSRRRSCCWAALETT